MENVSITEFIRKNVFCILQYILDMTEYTVFFSYFIMYSIIILSYYVHFIKNYTFF